MKASLKNRIKGTAQETKGKLKKIAGRATKNPKVQGQGQAGQFAGKARRKVGEAEKVLGD